MRACARGGEVRGGRVLGGSQPGSSRAAAGPQPGCKRSAGGHEEGGGGGQGRFAGDVSEAEEAALLLRIATETRAVRRDGCAGRLTRV